MAPSGAQGSAAVFGSGPGSSGAAAVRRYRRRNYFVKKWFQGRYVLYYLLIMLLSSAIVFSLILRHARTILHVEMAQGHSDTFNTWTILRPEMIGASLTVLAVVVVLAIAATLALSWSVRRAARILSSNISSYCMGEADTGRWTGIGRPVEFQHLQETMAKSVRSHHSRMTKLLGTVGDLRKLTRDAIAAGQEAPEEARSGLVRELRGRVEEMRSELGAARGGQDGNTR